MNTTQTQHRQDPQPVAFLIVEGNRTIILDQEITTIGRKADNHIVINHEYVSRHHAHIRFVDGQYLLEDLHSTVGTSLNGVRIQRAVLQPGDVISLGGAPIIFGLGSPRPDFDSHPPQRHPFVDSGPTHSSNLKDVDQYLDLFKPNHD